MILVFTCEATLTTDVAGSPLRVWKNRLDETYDLLMDHSEADIEEQNAKKSESDDLKRFCRFKKPFLSKD